MTPEEQINLHCSGNAHLRPNSLFSHGWQHSGGREAVSTLDQSENPALDRQRQHPWSSEFTYPAFRESNSGIDKLGEDILGGVDTGCSVDRERDDSSEDTG
jgi:hypothetical protein